MVLKRELNVYLQANNEVSVVENLEVMSEKCHVQKICT
jgi:hypothetical protein